MGLGVIVRVWDSCSIFYMFFQKYENRLLLLVYKSSVNDDRLVPDMSISDAEGAWPRAPA